MKIALITNYWKNSDGGGVRNYVINLVDALSDKGNDVCVLFRKGKDPEQFCGGRNKFAFALACFRQFRKERPEVILSQGTWYCLLPGAFYKKLHGCKLVLTFHTEPSEKLSFHTKIFFQRLLNACDCVTFVSKRLRERVIEVDGLSFPKTAITYAGVNAQEVTEEDVERFRERYGIDEDAIVLLAQAMTAHSFKVNGLKLSIRAMSILKDKYPNIVLIATREGSYSGELKKFAYEVGVGQQVFFTGDVENPFIPLSLCNIYVHTPLGEGGVSLALLEAMSLGKPIVATAVGGIPEAISDGVNGLLVKPDVEQIAEAINHLLTNMEYADELGQRAKSTVEENFTWEQTAERFLSIIEDCDPDGRDST